jgi:methylglutaconyl-CoA hydratase
MEELISAIDTVEHDSGIRAAILTNRGHVFCSGANLGENSEQASNISNRGSTLLSELLRRIQACPKPFVGRIAGHCVGGGVGLAAVMDISVAIEGATFGFSEVRIGVVPAIISVVCVPKMRFGDVQSAFIRGNRFSAKEAARIGLVNSVSSEAALDDDIATIVSDILAGEPHAIGVAKMLASKVMSMERPLAFDWMRALSEEMFLGDEAREGMAAFLEKRPASWDPRSSG